MRIPETRLVSCLMLGLMACGGEQPAERADQPSSRPAVVSPRDSLVLTLAGGAQVWFTASREGRDSAGTPCIERAVEVRRDSVRLPVPLLYTREAPLPVTDSQFRAVLYRDCMPVAAYRVGASDGMPHPEAK